MSQRMDRQDFERQQSFAARFNPNRLPPFGE
jgi:hypothetical protein